MKTSNDELRLSLSNPDARYLPGETVKGKVDWKVEQPPEKVAVYLKWSTRGKGSVDTQNVALVESSGPLSAAGTFEFSLRLPDEPYSFSSRNLSIIWKVGAYLLPRTQDKQFQEIVVSPTGEEIIINEILAAFEVVFPKKDRVMETFFASKHNPDH